MRNALKAAALATALGLAAGSASAADYRLNPFTLAYEGALTENAPGEVNIHPVTYELDGIHIAANVYTPADYAATKKAARVKLRSRATSTKMASWS